MNQRRGDLVVGGAWNNGLDYPDGSEPPVKIHRFGKFDNLGLVIAICGEAQVDRSNGWVCYPVNDYQRSQHWPLCEDCFAHI